MLLNERMHIRHSSPSLLDGKPAIDVYCESFSAAWNSITGPAAPLRHLSLTSIRYDGVRLIRFRLIRLGLWTRVVYLAAKISQYDDEDYNTKDQRQKWRKAIAAGNGANSNCDRAD